MNTTHAPYRKVRAFLLTCTLAAAALAGTSRASDPTVLERTLEREIPAEDVRTVVVRIRNGGITVRGEATEGRTDAPRNIRVRANVEIRAEAGPAGDAECRARAAQCLLSVELPAETSDSVLYVTCSAEDADGCSRSVLLEIALPRDIRVQATTENGDVDALNVSRVEASCANGNIELHGTVDAEATTENGGIAGERLTGSAVLRAGNGDINVELLGGARDVRIETTNGSVRLGVPGGLDARLDARVTMGTISHTGLPARSIRSVEPGSLQATLGNGSGMVGIRTSAGSITLLGR